MDFKYEIAKQIGLTLNTGIEEILPYVEVPANADMGDYSYPCFRLAKDLRKAPNQIASDLAEGLKLPEGVASVETVAAYVNFRIDKKFIAENVLRQVFEKEGDFGSSNLGGGKAVVIDFSSPNIAKPFHVGHLRSTVIGNAIYKIHKFIGYHVIGINHLGDWGTQFGKMIVAYKRWGDRNMVEEKGIRELVGLYVKFHDEAEKDDKLNEEARNWLLKMQQGDEEAITLWKWIFDVSMKEFDAVYTRLHVDFDYYTGESFYNDKMEAVVGELKEKNLLVESDGAQVVDLEQFGMPPCLILRKDGGTLYPTRDIAAARYRKENYDFYKSLYITGLEQNLHFAQWFKVIELMGYPWAKDLVHIPFGLVSLESGKLSTRKGNVIFMEDLLNEAVNKTISLINKKSPDLENKQEVAEQIGIGAIIFNDLYNSRVKDVVFSWEKMLNFDGETAPYVQYTYARANSVLSKAGYVLEKSIDFSALTDDESFDVIKLLYNYPEKLIESAEKYEPYIVTRHLVHIAQAFNRFYHENQILSAEESSKKARLGLTYAVKVILKAGLALLGVSAPDKM